MITVKRLITYKCDLCYNFVKLLSNEDNSVYDEVWDRYKAGIYPAGWNMIDRKLYCDKHTIKKTLIVDQLIVKSEKY